MSLCSRGVRWQFSSEERIGAKECSNILLRWAQSWIWQWRINIWCLHGERESRTWEISVIWKKKCFILINYLTCIEHIVKKRQAIHKFERTFKSSRNLKDIYTDSIYNFSLIRHQLINPSRRIMFHIQSWKTKHLRCIFMNYVGHYLNNLSN